MALALNHTSQFSACVSLAPENLPGLPQEFCLFVCFFVCLFFKKDCNMGPGWLPLAELTALISRVEWGPWESLGWGW